MNATPETLTFRCIPLRARFEEFSMAGAPALDAIAIVPTVRSTWWLRYGEHAYYCMDFRARRGMCVTINHGDVIGPGFARFRQAAAGQDGPLAMLRCLTRRYHYGFSFLEEIMLMTVPHTVTDLGGGKFLINLWSYFGYLSIDCRAKTATYHLIEGDGDTVLGATQWYNEPTGDVFSMAYSLRDSLARIKEPVRGVASRILRMKPGGDCAECVWAGAFADFMHDLAISPDARYWAVCELGMYRGGDGRTLPSRVLLGQAGVDWRRSWRAEKIHVAAHAEFDPEDADTVYLSSHNFQFEHTPLLKLLRQATYSVTFHGPAAILKYRVTQEGPQEVGCFSRADFKRLTNMHAFRSSGRKVIAAMGFPDEIFVVDPETMSFIRKMTVADPPGADHAGARAVIGTMTPSPDGTKLFVQTARSFQVVDMETGVADFVLCNGRRHSCANHMLASRGAAWT